MLSNRIKAQGKPFTAYPAPGISDYSLDSLSQETHQCDRVPAHLRSNQNTRSCIQPPRSLFYYLQFYHWRNDHIPFPRFLRFTIIIILQIFTRPSFSATKFDSFQNSSYNYIRKKGKPIPYAVIAAVIHDGWLSFL